MSPVKISFQQVRKEFVVRGERGGPSDRFTARILIPGPDVAGQPLRGFDGRWLVRDGLVVTAVTLPR